MPCDVLEYREIARLHRDYYARNLPVVLRGVPAAYPGLKVFEWSAQYFARGLCDTVFPVIKTRSTFVSYERAMEPMPYSEFYARSFGDRRQDDVYYYFKNSTALLPDGHDDSLQITELSPYLQRAVMKNLWISRGGLTVGLHFDAAENLNFQLCGRKTFVLYPAGVRGYYPQPLFSQTAHISGVYRDGPNPDLSRFPEFDASRAVRVDLEAGDILYVPAYWWHQVESIGDENVNLNFWWLPSVRKQLTYPNQATRGYAQLLLRYLKFRSIAAAPARRS